MTLSVAVKLFSEHSQQDDMQYVTRIAEFKCTKLFLNRGLGNRLATLSEQQKQN